MEDRIPGGLQHHPKMCCKKGGHCGKWACMIWRWFYCGNVISGWVDLHMTYIDDFIISTKTKK